MMDAHDGTSRPKLQSFLLAALVMLTAGCGMVGIAREAEEFGPRVGDIVMFDPAHRAGFDSDARLVALRPVSYTHLDVYKRQKRNSFPVGFWRNHACRISWRQHGD